MNILLKNNTRREVKPKTIVLFKNREVKWIDPQGQKHTISVDEIAEMELYAMNLQRHP